MAYFRCGGGGMPAGLQSGMDAVLNKKFGTSTTYPASGWPDNVNLLGPLPIIISNKAPIVSFNDGADDVPIDSGTFYIAPSQSGTGTPSPSNPRAISGYTGMTITHLGKNWFDYTACENKTIDASGVISPATTRELSPIIDCIAGNMRISFPTGVTFIGFVEYDSMDTFVRSVFTNNSVSVTITPQTNRIRLYFKRSDNGNMTTADLENSQLELGTTATTYEPYVTPETLAVSWQTEAGTAYGGELNVTTGVLTATWGEVDLGDLSWTYNASYLAFYATVNDKKNGSNGYIDIYDRTTYWITSQEWADANNVFYCSGGNKYLAIKNTDYSNAATFKTAMEGHKFVFELDTPVTYQLDPHELRTFYGANNFYCDTGDSQLNYRADISLYINNH